MSKASRPVKPETFTFYVQLTGDLFIGICRIIRKTNIEADTGLVWKSLCQSDGKTMDDRYFLLGIGVNPAGPLYFYLPIQRWEECYFAKELPTPPISTENPPTPQEIRESLSNLFP